MSEAPLVTIGLPVYNREELLAHSLDALLGQTHRDFVLIISDNASTDGTGDVCREYAARDPRIRYHRNDVNVGNPRNFNRVFELTQTKYLKWSTSDDWNEPTFVERALEVMEADESIALCYPKSYLVDEDGLHPEPYEDALHLVQDDPAERFLGVYENIGLSHQHLGLIRTSALRRTHLLGTHVGSDINLIAELALYGRIHELPERLFYRRFHPGSGSWDKGNRQHDVDYYKAAGEGTVDVRRLKRFLWHLQSVASAPLPLASKLRLQRYLLRQMVSVRDELTRELVRAGRARLRGTRA